MSEDAAEKRNPLKNLARVLVGVGLPAIGTAVAGPVGGVIAAQVARQVTGREDADVDAVAESIAAGAAPEALVRLRELETRMQEKQLEAITAQEAEITARHATDMASDSWLSKNVRPAGFAFVLIVFTIFVFVAAFWLSGEKAVNAQFYAGMIQGVLMSYLGFYVTSRGIEKVTHVVKGGRGE